MTNKRMEIPNDAYRLHSQILIGCSLRSQQYCELIAWYWKIMRGHIDTPYKFGCVMYKVTCIVGELAIKGEKSSQYMHDVTCVVAWHLSPLHTMILNLP